MKVSFQNFAHPLFSKVQTISNLYAKLAERHDDGFNIFEIMRMQSDEVHLHSRFIAELLNPKGTHGLGKTYLQLFLEYFLSFIH